MLVAAILTAASGQTGIQRVAGGVVVHPSRDPGGTVTVTVHGDGLFHVVAVPGGAPAPTTPSLIVPTEPAPGTPTITEQGGRLQLRTDRDQAEIDLATGAVSFADANGHPLLESAQAPRFTKETVGGKPFLAVSQQFNRGSDEGLYGLGQHQNAVMDWNGEDVELAQHNMDIAVPFLVSTRNYGLLWDNDGITRFGNPRPYRLLGEDLSVTSGGKPGFTAQYYLGDRLVTTRQEPTINYQYIRDQKRYPAAAKGQSRHATGGQNTAGDAVETQRVVWTGDVTAPTSGTHKFQLYGSSYYKVYMDGQLVLDRWRQNWNPWYANFDWPMTAGHPVKVRVEWQPNNGYIALLHNDPLPEADRHSVWLTSDVAQGLNYWFVPGRNMDDVVAGYRQLTGKATLMPKWAYGFWQSRQRYTTQDEVEKVVQTYRAMHVPIDNVVQDWFYWPQDAWGSHQFDRERFPEPQKLVDDLHGLHAHFMISVWPKFYPTTANFKELDANGFMYHGNLAMGNKDWVGPGYPSSDYDPYAPEARKIYWRQIKDMLARLNIDAWWLDASEPDMHSNLSIGERTAIMGPTAMGPAAQFFNSYPLMHVSSVFDGWRQFKPDVRPFILTRSGFAGLQREGAAVWSGDVASRWYDLRAQISAGVNLSMSGIPNWTHDIGGFTDETRYSTPDPRPQDLDEWRELNLRWFQFGAFSPLFRSHGEPPFREIYVISPEGSPMRASMIFYDQLRYRLMPYIYTIAADTWHRDGSIMRGLVMDWPNDAQARRLNDEYLFGRSLLVAPVTEYKARSRQVYLPATPGGWFDLYSGQAYRAGTVTVAAPLDRMPVFVRAGAIVPTGPVTQYVDEQPGAPLTINVFPGADGQFGLYEDDGTSEQYRTGAFSRVPIRFDNASGAVTIGAREGKGYPGMPATRQFRVRWVGPGQGLADEGAAGVVTVAYRGAAVTVRKPQ